MEIDVARLSKPQQAGLWTDDRTANFFSFELGARGAGVARCSPPGRSQQGPLDPANCDDLHWAGGTGRPGGRWESEAGILRGRIQRPRTVAESWIVGRPLPSELPRKAAIPSLGSRHSLASSGWVLQPGNAGRFSRVHRFRLHCELHLRSTPSRSFNLPANSGWARLVRGLNQRREASRCQRPAFRAGETCQQCAYGSQHQKTWLSCWHGELDRWFLHLSLLCAG